MRCVLYLLFEKLQFDIIQDTLPLTIDYIYICVCDTFLKNVFFIDIFYFNFFFETHNSSLYHVRIKVK